MLAASSYQSKHPYDETDDNDDDELDYKTKKKSTDSKHDGWLKRGDSVSSLNQPPGPRPGSSPSDMVVEIHNPTTVSDKNHNSPFSADGNRLQLKNGLLQVIIERDKSGKQRSCFFYLLLPFRTK